MNSSTGVAAIRIREGSLVLSLRALVRDEDRSHEGGTGQHQQAIGP